MRRCFIRGVVVTMLFCLSAQTWAMYGVRVPDLYCVPVPPNPVKTWGKVVSESPLKISDGQEQVTVIGVTAKTGDFLVVEGNWDGSVLAVSQLPGKVALYTSGNNTEMVYVPAGDFAMGNSGFGDDANYGFFLEEYPQHSVSLSGYWIGRYEVTRGEYTQFMAAGGYSNQEYWSADGWAWKISKSRTEPANWAAQQDWGTGAFTQTDKYPVVGVSYYEAEAFCNWAGGRLPTESQWEKAARWTGSHANTYSWGDTWDANKCNNDSDSILAGGGWGKNQTSPVGSYTSDCSPSGCLDMAGNATEWCKDWYGSGYYDQAPTDGWINPDGPSVGESSYRIVRGGAWSHGGSGYGCRCADRYGLEPSCGDWNAIGFRIVR